MLPSASIIAAFKPVPPTSIASIRSVLIVAFGLLDGLLDGLRDALPDGLNAAFVGALLAVLPGVFVAVLRVVLRVTTVSPDCVGATRR
ncbi:hypothetical protein [Paraburkholderia sp. BL17N1]|uniref:hypothetical protein n=1 Tax=Paraburkholderia sp. BL17N1 TaxID=1938798 RepID=UPI0018F42EAC|nr:hypothetical protein [Paraburkholderia sp. BL17N1]